MKVLVYEQFHSGHYYQYLSHLLRPLAAITNDLIVAITKEGRASSEFAAYLGELATEVEFECSLPAGTEKVHKNQLWQLHRDLRNAVSRIEPDYVLLPNGDWQTKAMGWFRLAGLGGLPKRPPGEVGIHEAFGIGTTGLKEACKDVVRGLRLTLSGWTRIHLSNLLMYEQVQSRGGALAHRSSLLPYPVQTRSHQNKTQSRRVLGLPDDGRYIGIVGIIDYRKAIGESLRAFRESTTDPSERLLIAGKMTPRHQRRIEVEFSDLVRSKRLLLMDEFLDTEKYRAVLAAMDVICIPYPGFVGVSNVLLEAVAEGRPVLTHDLGWPRALVKRFELGWLCDVLNAEAFKKTMRLALDASDSYTQSEATSRLLAFHAPRNFAESLLHGLKEIIGVPTSPAFKPWSWVLDALPTDRRNLL